jgi:hypothetical protein
VNLSKRSIVTPKSKQQKIRKTESSAAEANPTLQFTA